MVLDAFSCIQIQPTDLTPPQVLDWIFFYSPTSWELYIKSFGFPKSKIGVIGKGTQKAIEKEGISVDFTPESSDPKKAVQEFSKVVGTDQRVLVPKGNLSKNRLREVIAGSQLVDFVFYKTEPARNIPPTNAQHLFFTSPSNAQAYFSQNELKYYQKLYAIGASTAKVLFEIKPERVRVLEDPTEESLWELLVGSEIR